MMRSSSPALAFRRDDLNGREVRALIARHLDGMRAYSPPDSVHALDIEKLRASDVFFWSAWAGDEIAGMGALKRLDAARGEIKSMRVADPFLGQGIGRAILDHIMGQARAMGLQGLWLETGSAEAFLPARKLYESAGFHLCEPFEGYAADAFSCFMTRKI